MNKLLMRLLGWKFSQSPKDCKDYWVTNGDTVFLANAYDRADNGWSNLDTWEDFDGDVMAYKKCRKSWFVR